MERYLKIMIVLGFDTNIPIYAAVSNVQNKKNKNKTTFFYIKCEINV